MPPQATLLKGLTGAVEVRRQTAALLLVLLAGVTFKIRRLVVRE